MWGAIGRGFRSKLVKGSNSEGTVIARHFFVDRRCMCGKKPYTGIKQGEALDRGPAQVVGVLQEKCDILETIILDHDPKLLPPRGSAQQELFMREIYGTLEPETARYGPDTFEQVVIKEVHEHASRSPQGRRWSQAVAMFSFTWMSLSVQSHTSLRGYFSHYPVKLHCMVS